MEKRVRFHWSLSQAGDTFRRAKSTIDQSGLLNFEAQIALCQRAQECGIDSMLMAIGFTRPDPLLLSVMLGQKTKKINFMVAVRPGLISPTLFVQQINTLSCLVNGRVHVNIVNGRSPQELRYYGDFLNHDERFKRTEEFLAICNAFWQQQEGEVNFRGNFYQIENGKINTPFVSAERSKPEIFIGGNSDLASEVAGNMRIVFGVFLMLPRNLNLKFKPYWSKAKKLAY